MNENIDLTKILKNCPKGTKLYSSIWGEIYFEKVHEGDRHPITATTKGSCIATFTKEGFHYADEDGECILFPSKEQRDWNKFSAPWYKKEKFDPKTLKPFDKVLSFWDNTWWCDFFSHVNENNKPRFFGCLTTGYQSKCIPYNDETKHIAGTSEEAPDFYKYWED